MTIGSIDASQRQAARAAGYSVLLAMGIAIFSQFYLSSNLIVPGDAAQTAANILAHETLFRVKIVCYLLYAATIVVYLAALYAVLRPIGRGLLMAAVSCRLIYALMWVVAALNMLGALRLLGDASYLGVFEVDRLQVMARLHLAANFDAYYVGLPFFGLASTIRSYLWFKSRYIPRALAASGVITSAWCVACAFVFIVFPQFNKMVSDWWFDTPMGLFEMALGVWLLVKGLRPAAVAGDRQPA